MLLILSVCIVTGTPFPPLLDTFAAGVEEGAELSSPQHFSAPRPGWQSSGAGFFPPLCACTVLNDLPPLVYL